MTTYKALYKFRASREDAPVDLLRQTEGWKAVITLIDLWAGEPLTERSGYSTGELDAIERSQGMQFPMVLREWWRLAGKHPFVDPGLGDVSYFCLPPKDGVPEGARSQRAGSLTLIAVEDDQGGNCVGIHNDFIHELDPPVHGYNPYVDPRRMTGVGDYQGYYNAGSNLPSLIYTTLLWHICGHICTWVEPRQKMARGVLRIMLSFYSILTFSPLLQKRQRSAR